MSYEDLYRFTFTTDINGALDVSKMFEIDGRRTKAQNTRGSTFEVEQDLDGTALSVTQTKTKRGEVEVKSNHPIDTACRISV